MSTISESDTIHTSKKASTVCNSLIVDVVQGLPQFLHPSSVDSPLERSVKLCLENLTKGSISAHHAEQKDALAKVSECRERYNSNQEDCLNKGYA